MSEASLEDVVKQQKEQCIFCKIIGGEIPSFKVYEDDLVIAIMDINPAKLGHTLLMPKEHYPIMQLIPRETFEHLFKISKYLSIAIKKATLSPRVSIFVANGGIAGQQSTHFMIHIIPREDNDELEMLDCKGNLDADFKQINSEISPFISSFMHQQAENNPKIKEMMEGKEIKQEQKSEPEPFQATPEQKNKISQLFEENDEFRNLILYKKEELKEMIKSNEELANLFRGIDVDMLSGKLNEMNKNG